MRTVRLWSHAAAAAGFVAAAALLAGCRDTTARLSPEYEARFAAESIRHRAADLEFRYTEGGGVRGGRWENRVASIVVTGSSLLIHKNDKVGLELTPRTRREVEVRRYGPRIRISAGSGRSAVSWSFVPPDDPEGWARDIRAAINRRGRPPAPRRRSPRLGRTAGGGPV